MIILALDTSGETCSVAVADGAVIRAEYVFRHERRLIERLPRTVQFVLMDAGLAMSDVDAFAVGLGPGSFTGVRVGVTFAKVWAMATGKPVVGVSSLDALAMPYITSGAPRIMIAPTRKIESVVGFYPAWWDFDEKIALTVLPHAEIVSRARELWGTNWTEPFLIGEHAQAVWQTFPQHEINLVTFVEDYAHASVVATLAYRRLERGEPDDADSLVPLYVTPPPTG